MSVKESATRTGLAAAPAGSTRLSRPRTGRTRLRVIAPILGFGIIALNYAPMVWLAVMSVSQDPMSGIPGPFTFRWYEELWADGRWVAPLTNSIVLGVTVGLACALSTILVARKIPIMSDRLRGRLLFLFLLPLLVPGVLLGAGLFIYLRVFLDLKLGWWSIFLAHFVWAYPFALLAMLISASRFDRRLTDAAADLGASPIRAFFDIELPILLPGIVSAAMFGLLFSFSELARSVLVRGGKATLPIYEWTQASAHSSSVPLIYSLSTLQLIVSMLLVVGSFAYLFGRSSEAPD